MEYLLEAFIDMFAAGLGGGRRRGGPSLPKLLGWPLTIVMLALGGLGAALVVASIKGATSAEATFLLLLVPFLGTFVAGLAGSVTVWRSLAAAAFSTAIAVCGGGAIGLLALFASFAH